MNEDKDKRLDEDVAKMQKFSNAKIVKICDTNGNEYNLKPVSLRNIPKLMRLLAEAKKAKDKIEVVDENVNIEEMEKALNILAEILLLGIIQDNKDITIDFILDNFDISNFSEIVEQSINLNDFFAKKMERQVIPLQQE